jgi:hypothetical protein
MAVRVDGSGDVSGVSRISGGEPQSGITFDADGVGLAGVGKFPNVANPAEGDVLVYTGGAWVPSPLSLADIGDVSPAAPAGGDVLRYDTDANLWRPQPGPSAADFVPRAEYDAAVQSNQETFQKQLRQLDFATWQPVGNSTVVTQLGTEVTSIGTPEARSVSTTSVRDRQRRLLYPTTATTGTVAGIRHPHLQYFRDRGFHWTVEFGNDPTTTISSKRQFYGFRPVAGEIPNLAYTDTTNWVNTFFLGNDRTTSFSIYHAGSTGAPTRINLGTSFSPTNTTHWFRLRLSADSQGCYYKVTNRSTGAVAEGAITTNIPDADTLLTWNASVMTSTTAVRRHELGFVWAEMEFDLD